MFESQLDVHFDEPEVAEEFLAALAQRRISAEVSVDLFAGEDDYEDAARIVHVFAERDQVQDLIDEHGGWTVGLESRDSSVLEGPAELPGEPKRFKA